MSTKYFHNTHNTGDTDIDGTSTCLDSVFSNTHTLSGGAYSVDASGNVTGVAGTFTGSTSAVNSTLSGNLSAVAGAFSGAVTAASATLSGNITAVAGTYSGSIGCVNATLSGNLAAVGGTFSANVAAVDGTFSGSTSSVNSTLSGNLIAVDGSFSGNSTIGGTLGVTGVTTLSNNATVGGTLGVTSAATFSSTLASGAQTVTGNSDVSGDFTCTNATASAGVNSNTLVVTSTVSAGGGNFTVSSAGNVSCVDAVITGNLQVTGTTTSVDSTEVNIGDSHIYLNSQGVSGASSDGGLLVNYEAISGYSLAINSYHTGNEIDVSSSTGFTAGDFVQISGCSVDGNNGLWEVSSIQGGTRIAIETGGAVVMPFALTSLDLNVSGNQGTITRVKVSSFVIDKVKEVWKVASGSSRTDFTYRFLQDTIDRYDNTDSAVISAVVTYHPSGATNTTRSMPGTVVNGDRFVVYNKSGSNLVLNDSNNGFIFWNSSTGGTMKTLTLQDNEHVSLVGVESYYLVN